jgi:hypothetical protein
LSKAIDKRKNKKTKTNGHVFVQKRMHEWTPVLIRALHRELLENSAKSHRPLQHYNP